MDDGESERGTHSHAALQREREGERGRDTEKRTTETPGEEKERCLLKSHLFPSHLPAVTKTPWAVLALALSVRSSTVSITFLLG